MFRHNHAIIGEYAPTLKPLTIKWITSANITTAAKTNSCADKIYEFCNAKTYTSSSSSSIGTATLVGFGLLNYR